MASIFSWCCRRLRRGKGEGGGGGGGGDGGGEKEGELEEGEEGVKGQSASRPWLGKRDKKKRKKGKGREPEADGQADDSVGDLSVVKRETEVLRPYQKPPPPKNRARASRVPRGLKSQNAAASPSVFQELTREENEEEEEEDKEKAPDKKNTPPARLPKTEGGPQPLTPPTADRSGEAASETSADVENTPAVRDEDVQDDLPSSEADAGSEPPDRQAVVETVALEPIKPPADEGARSERASAKEEEDVESELSDSPRVGDKASGKEEDEGESSGSSAAEGKVSEKNVEAEASESQQTEDKASDTVDKDADSQSSGTAEAADKASDTAKDGASVKSEHEEPVAEQSEGDVRSAGGDVDEGGDGEDDNDEEKKVPSEQEAKEAVEQTDAPAAAVAGPDDSNDNSNVAESEEDEEKASLRAGASSNYPASTTKPTPGRGKRFPVPSVHGEGMDQLLQSLQARLKEDGISLRPGEKGSDQMDTDSKPLDRARSHSYIDQQRTGKVDTAGDTGHSQQD